MVRKSPGRSTFLYTLNYEARAYSWIRDLGLSQDGTTRTVETMRDYPACFRWTTDPVGNALNLEAITLATDPRGEIKDQILAAIASYNRMIETSGAQVQRIWTEDMEKQEPTLDYRTGTDMLIAEVTSEREQTG